MKTALARVLILGLSSVYFAVPASGDGLADASNLMNGGCSKAQTDLPVKSGVIKGAIDQSQKGSYITDGQSWGHRLEILKPVPQASDELSPVLYGCEEASRAARKHIHLFYYKKKSELKLAAVSRVMADESMAFGDEGAGSEDDGVRAQLLEKLGKRTQKELQSISQEFARCAAVAKQLRDAHLRLMEATTKGKVSDSYIGTIRKLGDAAAKNNSNPSAPGLFVRREMKTRMFNKDLEEFHKALDEGVRSLKAAENECLELASIANEAIGMQMSVENHGRAIAQQPASPASHPARRATSSQAAVTQAKSSQAARERTEEQRFGAQVMLQMGQSAPLAQEKIDNYEPPPQSSTVRKAVGRRLLDLTRPENIGK